MNPKLLCAAAVSLTAFACSSAPQKLGKCPELNERSGEIQCRHHIDSNTEVAELALGTPTSQIIKVLLPTRDDAFFDLPVFIATRRYSLHLEFLRNAVPEAYGAISEADYSRLFFEEDREYLSGSVERTRDGEWHFYLLEDSAHPASFLTRERAIEVWQRLSERLPTAELKFFAQGARQITAAAAWQDLPFEIVGVDSDYIAYNTAPGCGYVRMLREAELSGAALRGEISFRDILVIDTPPSDLDRVVSGIITGAPQGPLSHLAVRSAARNTFNAYLSDAFTKLGSYQDTLVCMEVGVGEYSIRSADLSEAEAFWDSQKPIPIELSPPDLLTETIVDIEALPTASEAQRRQAISAYGSKGANLAALYQRIDAYDSYKGLLIPAHYYDRFMRQGTWMVDLGEGLSSHSFQESVESWLSDTSALSNTALMTERLASLRGAMEAAPVSTDIVAGISNAITTHYASDRTMVRFRSSSNAEDSLGFSGAGLYDSTSVCPADSGDADDLGPSRCDSAQRSERSIERGLKRVWSSLWKLSAFEERSYYGMNQDAAMMAILVNDQAKNEIANAVAFSMNPLGTPGDDRMIITAQIGAYDLVSPTPGVRPETILLTRLASGLFSLDRVAQSTQTTDIVLSEVQAKAIGATLRQLENDFPIDGVAPENSRIMLDTEWKVLEDETLVIKQIRPFVKYD